MFIEKATRKFGAKFSYAGVNYTNSTTKVAIMCPHHGEVYVIPAAFLSSQYGCPQCGVVARGAAKRKGVENILDRLRRKHGDLYDYSRITSDVTHAVVEIGCKEHGWVRTQLHNLLKGQRGCIQCKPRSISRAKHGIEALYFAIAERGGTYQYDTTTFTNYLTPMRITCSTHGEFWQTPGNHFHQSQGCPCCFAANKTSAGEQALFDWIKQIAPDAINRCRSILAPKEIDIFVPSRNLGVEYHGLYWHADDRERTSLKEKWVLAQAKGIRLIQIFEDEWLNKREVVEDMLRAALGRRPVFSARKAEVRQIAQQEAKEFLQRWHISGYTRSAIHYGMFIEGGLVAVLTAGKSRFDSAEMEIIRFAAAGHISGGFRKMFRALTTDYTPTSVVSYADLRFGTGNTYIPSGFEDAGVTPPDYWWFKGQERLPRYKTQKHRLKVDPRFSAFYKEELTEREICLAAGYRRISGVGHRKFIWKTLQPDQN